MKNFLISLSKIGIGLYFAWFVIMMFFDSKDERFVVGILITIIVFLYQALPKQDE